MTYPKLKLRNTARAGCQMPDPDLHNARSNQPSPAFEFRPILVNTASPDEEGCLVLADGRLVAVLVRVAGFGTEQGRKEPSGWHMEAGFGPCAVPVAPLFDVLADAVAWMRMQLDAQ